MQNGVDPDQMPHSALFANYPFGGLQILLIFGMVLDTGLKFYTELCLKFYRELSSSHSLTLRSWSKMLKLLLKTF